MRSGSSSGISKAGIGMIASAVIGLVFVVALIAGGFAKNDTSNWQVIQSVMGTVTVKDDAGWYLRKFASYWTYPRAVSKEFKKPGQGEMQSRADRAADQSIGVTFNDGGTADMGVTIRFSTPATEPARRKLHAEFAGNIDNVTASVRSHLVNCAKATAPLMSSSEHMSARKAEFTQHVRAQLENGLYKMRRVEKSFKDDSDDDGDSITIFATEIVMDPKSGLPMFAQASPLTQYDLEVLQFSIEDTDYDPKTLEKFAAKKDSLLKAEQAKADREQEVQQRLMIVEKGLRQKAEVEAIANVERTQAVINAERIMRVAELDAEMKASVALQTKIEAETKSAQKVAVAKLELDEERLRTESAAEQGKQVILLAAAEEERIKKAGAVTEMAQVMAEIQAQRDVDVARELAKIAVPGVTIGGGQGGGGGVEGLIQMILLRASGVIPEGPLLNSALAGQPSND